MCLCCPNVDIRLSTAVNSNKYSESAAAEISKQQNVCYGGSALVQAELNYDDDFCAEEEEIYVHCGASPLTPPLSASSSSSLLDEENKRCSTNKKRTATSKSKLPLKFVDSRQQIHVEEECGGDAQKTPLLKKEETLTQTTIEMEQVRVGEEVINKEMIVLREHQVVYVHPSRQQQKHNQLQEVESAAIYKVGNPPCETGGRSIGSMKRAVLLPERTATTVKMVHSCSTSIPATTDDCGPKATITTEEMAGQQGALAGYESEIVVEDGEGGQTQVLIQMLVAAWVLTAECKRELNIERTAHQATKDELNRMLLSSAASNKSESAILEEEGGRGDSDDVAVVVGQGETSKSLTMEVQRLASELKVRCGAAIHIFCTYPTAYAATKEMLLTT